MEAPAGSGGGYGVDFDPRSPVKSYFRIARYVAVEPESFFRAVRGGGMWRPTLFVFVTYLLVALISALIFVPVLALWIPLALQDSARVGGSPWLIALGLVVTLVLTPFVGVLATFLGAAIWHPFVALSVGIGRGAGFRETYRISAYGSLPYAASNFVPVVGPFVALAATCYVGIYGVKGAHDTTTTRAVVSVAVPLVLTFLLLVALLVVALVYLYDVLGAAAV